MENEMKIYVFADFLPFQNELIGTIYVSQTRGKEFYSFEYDEQWLEKQNMVLDPDLQLYKGRQYINDDKNIFGMFADSCPDRWGQRLMKRREEIRARKAEEKPRKLLQREYMMRLVWVVCVLKQICRGNSYPMIRNLQRLHGHHFENWSRPPLHLKMMMADKAKNG